MSSFRLNNSEEISLYDKNGDAKAYIASDLTVYLWDGDPVAYLHRDNNDWHLYGFNGEHLGWYINGLIYDNEGYAIGAQKDAVRMITSIEGIKGIKGLKPIKSIKSISPIKPILSNSWSRVPFSVILNSGIR